MLSKQLTDSKKVFAVVGASLAVLGCYVFLICNIEALVCDALGYYRFAQTLVAEDGGFSLQNFDGGIRGVSFALLIYGYDWAAKLMCVDIRYLFLTGNFILFFICAAMFARFFFPQSFFTVSKSRRYFGIILVLFIFVLLARFAFTTALTDFPALCLCLLSVMLCLYVTDAPLSVKTVLAAVLGGALIYTAYNFRTIYMFSALLMLCFFAVRFFKSGEKGRTLLVILAFFIGIGLAAVPQMVVNMARYSSMSPMLLGTNDVENGSSLFVSQLYWGLDICRYDTYISSQASGGAGFEFHWAPGVILSSLLTGQVQGKIIFAVLKHPLTYVALYIDHFLNMLSPYFTKVYVTDLYAPKWPYLISMYTVCYFVVWDIMAKIRSREYSFRTVLDRRCLPLLAVLFPALAIVPGAVEYRFGLPLFWLLFSYFVFQCSWKKRLGDIKKEPLRFVVCFLAFLGFMLVFWTQTLASGGIPLGL